MTKRERYFKKQGVRFTKEMRKWSIRKSPKGVMDLAKRMRVFAMSKSVAVVVSKPHFNIDTMNSPRPITVTVLSRSTPMARLNKVSLILQ